MPSKMILLAFHCMGLKMMASSKPRLMEDIIQVAVVVKDIIEATCSEDRDGGSGVVAVF